MNGAVVAITSALASVSLLGNVAGSDEAAPGGRATAIVRGAHIPAALSPEDSHQGSLVPPGKARPRGLADSLGGLPLSFIENRGQIRGPVDYYVEGSRASLYFSRSGLTLGLIRPGRGARPPRDVRDPQASPLKRWLVRLDFAGARPDAHPIGQGKLPGVVSYFAGPRSSWSIGNPTFARIVYRRLWPGIDMAFFGSAGRLKYEFLVHPGANPSDIRMAYRGASVRRLRHGQLRVSTPIGGFTDAVPMAFQRQGGGKVRVQASYRWAGAGRGTRAFGFRVGAFDRHRTLVIDPAVVVYAGYIGGHRRDSARAVAVDASGNAYVTGAAASHQSSFPVRVGPDLTFNGSFEDAFVAKVDQSGKRLEYAGYIGGSGGETGSGIAVDASGNAYVAGYTSSTSGTFPATGGPDLTYGGRNDAFVAKVDATGTGLDYAGYVGGTNVDRGSAVAVDGSGNAYVTGFTRSHETSFPVTVGPDTTYSHAHDAFVAKVNAAGSGFDYAGYIGGLGNDQGAGIAVDSSGHAYVTGNTGSDQTTLPVTVGPDLVYNGNVDAFVANVDPTGIGFDYLGYIGGPNLDGGGGVAVDGAGHAYIAGGTFSTQSTFPVAVGPDLTYNGGHDAFVAKVDVSGAALDYAGYIGGAKEDGAGGIAVDGSGHAYVVGSTESGESTFPVSGGPDLTQNGDQDAYVAKVTASGHGLAYAGYVGGSKFEFGAGIAVDGSGNAYLSGITTSNHHTFPVTTGPDLTFNGGAEAFVAKVGRCTMTGTPGHDVLTGTAGDDVICGLGGDDTLTGGKGDDVLYGASGNDTLAPGPGRNTVYGGKGVDTVTYRSLPGGGVRVHLDTAPGTTGGGATDSLRSIRNVIGTSFGDRVHGDGAANTVLGLDGNDALYGRSGNDRLDGGSNGSSGDSLFGGPGTDTCMRGEHVAGCER